MSDGNFPVKINLGDVLDVKGTLMADGKYIITGLTWGRSIDTIHAVPVDSPESPEATIEVVKGVIVSAAYEKKALDLIKRHCLSCGIDNPDSRVTCCGHCAVLVDWLPDFEKGCG